MRSMRFYNGLHTSRIGKDLIRGVIDNDRSLEIGHGWCCPVFLANVVAPLFRVETFGVFP